MRTEPLPLQYVRAGFALVPIPSGTKGPQTKGWQLECNAIRTEADAANLNGGNIGIAHRWCGTCAVDLDDYEQARAWLAERGVDVQLYLSAEDAVQIRSGRPNRAKLLYRLPAGVEWLPTQQPEGSGLELRCASRDGATTLQDVLPPSIHPDTGKPYEWAGDWRNLPTLPADLLEVWKSLAVTTTKAGIVETGKAIKEGGRNVRLTSLAGTMRRQGMEQAAIEAALLSENASKCHPPLPDAEVRGIAKSIASKPPAVVAAPEPLRRVVPPAVPYPLDKLGGVLRPAAESLRRVIQAPDAIIGGALLAASSLATQALADVHVDGRRTPLSLWLLNVAESGERKSAVDSEVMRAARECERALSEKHKADARTYEAQLAEWNARCDAAKKQAAGAKGKGLAEALEDLPPRPVAPLIPRLTAADFTAEGLFKLLQAGYPSIGAFTDEAALVFGGHGMQAETIMRTAGALSTLWDRGELDRVRSGDGAQKLYGRRFAMHLLAQPVIAERALSDDVLIGQGFLARCLLSWPQGTAGTRTYRAETLSDDPAMQACHGALLRLHRLPLPTKDEAGQELEPRALVLTTEAKALWCDAANTIERGMTPSGRFVQVKAWASKCADQVLRIAGVLALVGDADARQIDADTIERAVELALWHLEEAVRLVGAATLSPEVRDAEALLNWCHETRRDCLYSTLALNRGPARIRENGKFRAAMDVLERASWAHPLGAMELDGALRRNVWRIVLAREGG